MASITKQRVGKYTYLYESVSFRDEQGRPRNKKTKIGKIDHITGKPVYTADYIARSEKSEFAPHGNNLPTNAVPHEIMQNAMQFFTSIKTFGVFWFLLKIAEQIGLINILQQVFPFIWREIFTIACYLVVSDKPIMYCEDWLEENEWFEVGSMSSQRTSEIFVDFDETQRYQFYQLWSDRIQEREYLALDITSISSYSKHITDCEWGYNRDHEKLPQINLCMLYGETSRLPVFQANYSGSLGDVTTLESTIGEFRVIVGEREINLVMDKGFYSAKNVNFMIEQNVNFLVAMSFSNKTAKQLVENERQEIDRIENVILTNNAPIRGVHRIIDWSDIKLHAHIFFNPEKAIKERNELYGYVARLKEVALKNPADTKYKKDIERFLRIETAPSGIKITARDEVVEKSLATTGWFILLSNHIEDSQSAYEIYRMKDVVEKSFWKYKNSLGLERLRVHSDKRALNKTFVAFIALILSSHIHNVMRKNGLFKNMTFDSLFIILSKLKSAFISGHRVLRPLSKQLRDVFETFNLPMPVG